MLPWCFSNPFIENDKRMKWGRRQISVRRCWFYLFIWWGQCTLMNTQLLVKCAIFICHEFVLISISSPLICIFHFHVYLYHSSRTSLNKLGILTKALSLYLWSHAALHFVCNSWQKCGKAWTALTVWSSRGGGGLPSLALTYIYVFCFPHVRRMCIAR